ncbi:MAG: NAD(P)H-binding protein [Anaerolineales bacterium]
MTHTITLTRTIQASPKAVYRAFTTSGGLLEWFCNSSNVDARVGGHVFTWSNDGNQMMGKFTGLEGDKRIALNVYDPNRSHIKILIDGENGAANLTVEHGQIKSEDELENYETRWESALDNLQSILETGFDKRIYDRPMLGLLVGGVIDEDSQERYGIPVAYGILVAGVIKGLGAEAIGLATGDVLVKMGGIDLKDFNALQQAVAPRKAGDSVEVVWYRGSEKHEAGMTLSGRPRPQIPATRAELSEEVRQIHTRIDAELAEIFDGLTEEEAVARPAEGEWNAKETIAHLILTERAAQYWAINAAHGRTFPNWTTDDHNLIESVVAVYPTVSHLLAEMRRTEEQTVALLARLPEETLNFKGTFHNIATTFGVNGLPLHTRMHFSQISDAVASAKQSTAPMTTHSSLHAVTGAFGYTGRYITRRLLAQGQRVITLTGHPDRPNPFGEQVKAFPFNFDNPAALAASLDGVDVLYNTYWVRFSHGQITFDGAVRNTQTLIDAAKTAGVRRIVHVSITNPSLDSPLPYFSGKGKLEAYIQASGLSYAILRPTVIFGVEDILLNNIAYLLRRFPIFVVPGSGKYKLQPIFVEDMAELAVRAGAGDEDVIVDAIGPETFTFDQIVGMIARQIGSRSRIIHLPPGVALFLSRLVGALVNDVVLTQDEVHGLMDNLLLTDSPPAGKTRFSEWVQERAGLLGEQYHSELKRHYIGR